MTAESTRRLRCRFCDWSIPSFITKKDGSIASGMQKLIDHVHDQHEDEMEKEETLLSDYMRGREQ